MHIDQKHLCVHLITTRTVSVVSAGKRRIISICTQTKHLFAVKQLSQ